MEKEASNEVTTLLGVAVAVVALARFVAEKNSELAPYLAKALASAESLGMSAIDLKLLRTIIMAITSV